jgi:UDP-N-acetyl-D-mannosaminuronic acid dehydrogenase
MTDNGRTNVNIQSDFNNQQVHQKIEGMHLWQEDPVTPSGLALGTQSSENNDSEKVLVIGLGQLGLPVAKYVKERGFDTYGYDISEKAIGRAEKIAAIKKADNFSEFDVYIICISTRSLADMFTPQIDGLLSIVEEKIAKEAKNGALVSIESTTPRGTSKKVFEMLNHKLHVAHVPHRWHSLEEKEHGVNQLRVVGGVCDCCLKAAIRFYSGSSIEMNASSSHNINANGISGANIFNHSTGDDSSSSMNLGIPLHCVSNIEIAEITKIAENAHRYLQIAFAEDLYLYCPANNIVFAELRDALNTKWNVNILEPRDGIGGHCLPKDTKMFLQSSKHSSGRSKILNAAIEVDKNYRRYRKVRSRTVQQTRTATTMIIHFLVQRGSNPPIDVRCEDRRSSLII